MLTLEALKTSCEVKEVAYFNEARAFFDVMVYLKQNIKNIVNFPKRFLLKMRAAFIKLKTS